MLAQQAFHPLSHLPTFQKITFYAKWACYSKTPYSNHTLILSSCAVLLINMNTKYLCHIYSSRIHPLLWPSQFHVSLSFISSFSFSSLYFLSPPHLHTLSPVSPVHMYMGIGCHQRSMGNLPQAVLLKRIESPFSRGHQLSMEYSPWAHTGVFPSLILCRSRCSEFMSTASLLYLENTIPKTIFPDLWLLKSCDLPFRHITLVSWKGVIEISHLGIDNWQHLCSSFWWVVNLHIDYRPLHKEFSLALERSHST